MYSFSSCTSRCFSSIISHERVQRSERQALILAEQRGGAVDVQARAPRAARKRRRRQTHRPRQQRVVEQPLLVHSLEHRFARAMQRQPAEFVVQVIGRLAQIVGSAAAR